MRLALSTLTLLAALSAACGESPPPSAPTPVTQTFTPPAVPVGLSSTLTSMLYFLPNYIVTARVENEGKLPLNPNLRTWIQAKLDVLKSPALVGEIMSGERWVEGQASSTVGPPVPVVGVFMLESMRPEAGDTVRFVEAAVPLIEDVFDAAFPIGSVKVWYGFVVGFSGGGGVIYSEDRTTYESRTWGDRLPFESVLAHEAAHSYLPHESLTQFIEVYVYNVVHTGSTDVAAWTALRNWVPGLASNTGVAALLDVYRLVGPETMKHGYRAVRPLRPPYGQALSAAVIQAFVDQVPPALQAEVSAKLANVGY